MYTLCSDPPERPIFIFIEKMYTFCSDPPERPIFIFIEHRSVMCKRLNTQHEYGSSVRSGDTNIRTYTYTVRGCFVVIQRFVFEGAERV
jgi:hypothetical protein